MQHEILSSAPLLDAGGDIREAGFARRMLPVYRRCDVKASPLRLKEWDYYLVSNGRFALALTIADNGYMGLDSISLLDLEEKWEITKSPMSILPLGRTGLPERSSAGVSAHRGPAHRLSFSVVNGRRTLIAEMKDFGPLGALSAEIVLSDEPEESMVICTPFQKSRHFYYNQKINCMRATGTVAYGDRTYRFTPDESFAVLDWGRGVWTYHNTWYWGSASYHVNGVPFGWNIGYGFGDTSAATENMLFYNGKAHKLNNITFHIPGDEKDFLSPWTFSSDDGRFSMDFIPTLDRASCTDFKILKSDQHQVFGRFSGEAVLDDGTVIEVKDFPGFAEKVENKW